LEKWIDIEGFEGIYQVSNFGKVKRLQGYVKNKQAVRVVPEKILTPTPNETGYLRVRLSFKNKSTTHRVHRLVAKNFVANPNNYSEVNHEDLDKTNNHYSNLTWVTRQENVQHALKNNPRKNSKVTEEIKAFIRQNSIKNSGKFKHKEMAEMFGLSTYTVSDIYNYKGRYK
jgi:hypothetical protein